MLSKKQIKSPVMYNFTCQSVILLPVFLFLVGIAPIFAYSFVLGAAVFAIANLYFTAYASQVAGAQNTHWALKQAKHGQMGKFVLSALGFALVFNFFESLLVVAVFIGFFFMVLLQWFIAAKLVANKVFYPKMKMCK